VVEEDSTGTSVARLVVMSTREIPKDQWQGALDRFSRDHEGCVARISITPRDRPLQIEARDLPLQGVSRDSHRNDTIAIALGDRRDDHLTHEVSAPVRLVVEESGRGDQASLCIGTAEGTTVQVECREHHKAEQA
jgi:Family of unknown function (DUF5335)